jgi:putative ABC transport system permease protein
VGKTIRDIPRFSDKVKEFLITGVIKDLPSNTHIRAEALVINKSFTEQLTPAQNGTFVKQYVLLNKSANPELFLQKMNSWYKKFITAENPYQYDLQPIFEVYLNSAFDTSLNTKGSMQAIHIFSGIALLLLVIACFNFINLSSSRLLENLNRTGVRRVLGASKLDIALQVLVEAVCMFMLAAFFAWLFYLLLFPLLEQFIGHPLHLNFSTNFSLLGTAFLILLLLAVLSSAWQAWLISGINPVLFLKGELMKSAVPGKNYLQQSLVVMQFAISIGVVLATIIVQKQVQFLHNKDLGFNKNNLLSIGSVQWDGKGPAFKRELLQVPGVMAASFTTWIPGQGEGYMSRDLEDPANPGNKLKLWYIDGEISLPATLGLTLNEGRMLDEKFALDMPQSDTNAFQHCLITETTLKALQIENLNKPIATVDLQPVGVLQDFNSTSLHSPINPTIITAAAQTDFKYGAKLIRVVPGKEMEVANAIDKIWKNYFQALEPEIDIVSELMAKLYDKESSQLQLFKVFSSLTMLLAAMGVFGLMLQMINRRIKEIGIRKVLGASPEKILVLLSADFFKLVLFASMIALPLVYWMMQHWLNNFAYRIIPGWWMPALATMCGIAIMLLAILMQALRAARANPINSLRTQ